jgi:hypothetical protein
MLDGCDDFASDRIFREDCTVVAPCRMWITHGDTVLDPLTIAIFKRDEVSIHMYRLEWFGTFIESSFTEP